MLFLNLGKRSSEIRDLRIISLLVSYPTLQGMEVGGKLHPPPAVHTFPGISTPNPVPSSLGLNSIFIVLINTQILAKQQVVEQCDGTVISNLGTKNRKSKAVVMGKTQGSVNKAVSHAPERA